jgi:hypothetical protein
VDSILWTTVRPLIWQTLPPSTNSVDSPAIFQGHLENPGAHTFRPSVGGGASPAFRYTCPTK